MNGTSITDFRAQMKEWMDNAHEGPIRVNRPNGKAVVVVDAQAFEKMALELAELRGVIKGLKAVAEGQAATYSSEELKKISEESQGRFKARHAKKTAV